MIDLYNETTGELIGQVTEADLQVLVDALEEESTEDRDYFIDAATIDAIADGRATEHLVALLRKALGSADGVDIRWERLSLETNRSCAANVRRRVARATRRRANVNAQQMSI
jgi:hypothetical protein